MSHMKRIARVTAIDNESSNECCQFKTSQDNGRQKLTKYVNESGTLCY